MRSYEKNKFFYSLKRKTAPKYKQNLEYRTYLISENYSLIRFSRCFRPMSIPKQYILYYNNSNTLTIPLRNTIRSDRRSSTMFRRMSLHDIRRHSLRFFDDHHTCSEPGEIIAFYYVHMCHHNITLHDVITDIPNKIPFCRVGATTTIYSCCFEGIARPTVVHCC